MSSLDSKSVKNLQTELLDGLGILEAGKGREETIIEKVFDIKELGRRLKIFKNLLPVKPEDIDNNSVQGKNLPVETFENFAVVRQEGAQRQQEPEILHVFKQFQELLDDSILIPGITVFHDHRGIVLSLQDRILFASGQVDVLEGKMPLIGKIAAVIDKTKLNIYIEGHTDSTPVHSSQYPSNWELSVVRAVNLAEIFIDRFSIDPGKVRVSGYADMRPVASNSTEEGRNKNRRIEIILSKN
jgi:flagellar motor protein MotB